jgi:hypothetical protein
VENSRNSPEDQELAAFLEADLSRQKPVAVARIPVGCAYRIHNYDDMETVIPRPHWEKCARELARLGKGTLTPEDACDMTRFLLEHPDGRVDPPKPSIPDLREYLLEDLSE